MIWIVLAIWVPMLIIAAVWEAVVWYIDWRREKYGRFIGVNFRKQWM